MAKQKHHCLHGSARQVVIGHCRFLRESKNTDPLQLKNLSTDSYQNWHGLSQPQSGLILQIWYQSDQRGRSCDGPICMWLSVFFFFLFRLRRYSPNRPTDFHGWWLKRRVFAQGRAFFRFHCNNTHIVGVAFKKPPFFTPFLTKRDSPWEEDSNWRTSRTNQPILVISGSNDVIRWQVWLHVDSNTPVEIGGSHAP